MIQLSNYFYSSLFSIWSWRFWNLLMFEDLHSSIKEVDESHSVQVRLNVLNLHTLKIPISYKKGKADTVWIQRDHYPLQTSLNRPLHEKNNKCMHLLFYIVSMGRQWKKSGTFYNIHEAELVNLYWCKLFHNFFYSS